MLSNAQRLQARSEPVASEGYIAETWNKRDGLLDTTLSKIVQTQSLHYSAPESLSYDLNIRGPRASFSKHTTERSERFYDLEPGAYQIDVRAHDREGPTGPATRLAFKVTPFIWQTGWFKWTSAAVLLVVSAVAIRYLSSLIIRNITPLKNAEAARMKLEQQLRQAQKMEAIGLLADQPGPLAAVVIAAPETPAEPVAAAVGGVLLVEDEAGVRLYLKRVLEKQGYRVHVAASGREALHLWESIRHDVQLLISDVVMPGGVTGVQLSEKLRAEKATLKVILCSGYNAELVQIQACPRPGVAFLQKPFYTESFLATIQTLTQPTNAVG